MQSTRGGSLAAIAGRAAARQSLAQKDLARVGFQGAEQLRRVRAQAQVGALNRVLPHAESLPKGYVNTPGAAAGRVEKAFGLQPGTARQGYEQDARGGGHFYDLNDPLSYQLAHPGRGQLVAGTVGTPFTYAAAGLVQAGLKPRETIKALGHDYGQLLHHPIGYVKKNPAMAAADAWALGSLGASGAMRGMRAAAFSRGNGSAAALQGRLGVSPAASMREALLGRPLAKPPLRIYSNDAQGLYSRNPLRFVLQKGRDRALGNRPPVLVNDKGVNERMTEPVRQAYAGETPPEPRTPSIGRAATGYLGKLQTLAFFGLKPSFIFPNVAGQELLMGMGGNLPVVDTIRARRALGEMAQQNPRARAAFQAAVSPSSITSGFQHPRFDPTNNKMLERISQSNPGVARALGVVGKGLDRAVLHPIDVASDIFSNHLVQRLIDRPQREASLFKEFNRQGFKGQAAQAREIQRLAEYLQNVKDGHIRGDQPPPPQVRRVIDAVRRANNTMVDYGGLTKAEEAAKGLLFIYPFTRGATKYAIRYPLEHPVGAAGQAALGNAAANQANQDLGERPSIMEGALKTGEKLVPGLGRVPTVSNPQAAAILGAGPQFLSQIANFFSPHPSGAKALSLGENFSPFLMGAAGGSLGIDPTTGRQLPHSGLRGALEAVADSTPQANLVKRGGVKAMFDPATYTTGGNDTPTIDPRKTLYPYGGVTALLRYMTLGQGYPVPENPVKGAQLSRAENAIGKSKTQQAQLRGEAFLRDLAGKQAALQMPVIANKPGFQKMVQSYVTLRGTQDEVRSQHKSDARYVNAQGALTQYGQLYARYQAAKKLGIGVGALRANLNLLGRYAQMMNTTASARKLPYAQGGNPLPIFNR